MSQIVVVNFQLLHLSLFLTAKRLFGFLFEIGVLICLSLLFSNVFSYFNPEMYKNRNAK